MTLSKFGTLALTTALALTVVASSAFAGSSSCSLDTDDANLRAAAAKYVRENVYTSSNRVKNLRVGMAGLGAPGENRTLYFSLDLESDAIPNDGEIIRLPVAGKLTVRPDCSVTGVESQVLVDAE